ncbi:MAG: hypothetical protein ACI9U2_000121 [Bradymonadia bacterium]|jgi:hypothetical protein
MHLRTLNIRFLSLSLVLGLLGCADAPESNATDARVLDAAVDARVIAQPTVDMARGDASVPDGGAPTDGDVAADATVPDAAPPAAQCADGLDNDGDGRVDLDDRGCSDAADDDEGDEIFLPECADAEDNDVDGLIDTFDPDCSSAADPRERGENVTTACNNGLDDDDDGAVDFPEDTGCSGVGDDDETSPQQPPRCANDADDDDDGLTDWPADPGCAGRGDGDEADPPRLPACANGVDDDGDGAVDWPADAECESAANWSEEGICGVGVPVVDLTDETEWRGDLLNAPANAVGSCGGGAGGERVFVYRVERPLERLTFSTINAETGAPTVLYIRRRCGSPGDLLCDRGTAQQFGVSMTLEQPAPGRYYLFVDTGARDQPSGAVHLTIDAEMTPACRDGLDNDEDGLIDNADPGCIEPDGVDEADPDVAPICADGLDNDMDGLTDHPDDPECRFAGGDQEGRLCAEGVPVLFAGQRGGMFDLPVPVGQGAESPSCEPLIGGEVAIQLTLEEPSDVTIRMLDANGMPVPSAMYVRADCEAADSEVACAPGMADQLVAEALPAGIWFILLEQGFGIEPGRVATIDVLSVIGECNDGVDNDNDGLIDLFDIGCEQGRDQSELDPAALPDCANGIDDDQDGLIDYPDDNGCVAAGDVREGGCDGNPLWEPVRCQTNEWVWSNNRQFITLEAAFANQALYTGCRHANDDNDDGYCSLSGTGWVSTQSLPMANCNANWTHIGGRHSGNCGGHDGDTTRRLVLDDDACFDY